MSRQDVSYLYSDEWLISLTSDAKQSSEKVSPFPSHPSTCTRPYQKTPSISPLHHRSKHILISREDIHQRNDRREKSRMAARRLREKRQSFEHSLLRKIKLLDCKRLELEHDLKQRQAYTRNLETEIINTFYLNSPGELSFTEKKQISLSNDQSFADLKPFLPLTTGVLDLNNNVNENFDN